MHVKNFVHKMLMDSKHQDGGYDIKTIIFAGLPWPNMEECRVVMADGKIFSAIFEDGEKISAFVEMPATTEK